MILVCKQMNKSSTKDRDPPLSVALKKDGIRTVLKSSPGILEPTAGQQRRFFRRGRIVSSLGEDEPPAGQGRTKKNKRKTFRRKTIRPRRK